MKTGKFFIVALIALNLMGCDVLDKSDLNSLKDNDVWSNPTYATYYLDKLYRDNAPGWDTGISGYSDEADGYGNSILYGQLTINSINTWNYTSIRNINLLLQKVDGSTLDDTMKQQLKGQALILRAWRYFEMVRQYGGVPLILTPQDIKDNLYVTRNKTSECIAQICKDLEEAYGMLPWNWTGVDEGRFTKATALALEGRIKLYYASAQFNPSNNKERWKEAYEVNKRAYSELKQNGYALYNSYANLWFDEMNCEDVMVKRYNSTGQGDGYSNHWNAATRPLSEAMNYTGANHPTWDLVESYSMKDGKKITESADYDDIHFWRNRDPRFAATIAYNCCMWNLSGKENRHQWTYEGSNGSNTTQTGFYCRKAVDEKLTPNMSQYSSTDWVEIRFAEVMLNYAECAAYMDKADEAYDMLKQIRQRAGIEKGTDGMFGIEPGQTGDKLVTIILDERKIELAFEGKRYWDLRRCRLFATELNGKSRKGRVPHFIDGMTEAKLLEVEKTADFDRNYTQFFRDDPFKTDKLYTIDFKDNYYFFAIPQKHLQTNSKIEQTKGWEDGTFDPLL